MHGPMKVKKKVVGKYISLKQDIENCPYCCVYLTPICYIYLKGNPLCVYHCVPQVLLLM